MAARRVLLDGLAALGVHCDAVVLVGAQAIYLRTDMQQVTFSASFTTDADLAVDPRRLGPEPEVSEALRDAGFELQGGDRPGIWSMATVVAGADEEVTMDLLVPEALAGRGRRSAEVPPHDKLALTRAEGLEAALVDHEPLTVSALDPADTRSATVEVAGLPALLVAKLFKLAERLSEPGRRRVRPKDAADIYRILLAVDPAAAAATINGLLSHPDAATVTATAIEHLTHLFGAPRLPGVELAVQALAGDVPADRVAAVCVRTVSELQRLV